MRYGANVESVSVYVRIRPPNEAESQDHLSDSPVVNWEQVDGGLLGRLRFFHFTQRIPDLRDLDFLRWIKPTILKLFYHLMQHRKTVFRHAVKG